MLMESWAVGLQPRVVMNVYINKDLRTLRQEDDYHR